MLLNRLGGAAVVAMAATIAVMAWTFGVTQLGVGSPIPQLYGVLGVLVVILNVVSLAVTTQHVRARRYGRALAGAIVFSACLIGSAMTTYLSIYAQRSAVSDAGAVAVLERETLMAEMSALRQQLAAVGIARPASVVRADISASRGKAARRLRLELERSIAADSIRGRMSAVQSRLSSHKATGAPSAGLAAIASKLGWDAPAAYAVGSAIIVIVSEIVMALGVVAMTASETKTEEPRGEPVPRPKKRQPAPDETENVVPIRRRAIDILIDQHSRPVPGASTPTSSVKALYRKLGGDPADLDRELRAKGFRVVRKGSARVAHYSGLTLAA